MRVDFDIPTNRLETDSIRWDAYDSKKVLPLWVADMDFQSPPCVIQALSNRVQHGIFGYTHSPKQFNQIIARYLLNQYDWSVDPDWIVILPSVVSALYTAVQQLTNVNDSVLIPNPVYHHLRLACTEAGRKYHDLPLRLVDQRWVLPNKELPYIATQDTKLALLCNPQNPGSTVFNKDELMGFGDFCIKNNLWICSDEIHAGLVLDGKKHIPIASLSKDVSKRTITLMSLNKTFNFPGVGLAWAVAENPDLRNSMRTGLHQTIAEPSLFAYTATLAAITDGEPWRQELLKYLQTNRDLVTSRINHIDNLSVGKIEGSYLAWIDCTNLNHQNPHKLFLDAGVATSPGSQFGQPNFIRLNFGTQKSKLAKALDIIQNACLR